MNYSVASPEACASIVWRESDKAPEAAEAMKVGANDLKKIGIVDEIIVEPIEERIMTMILFQQALNHLC